ncbi:unnamed protein product [Adineta ricciae]|uniref:Uncharacterized protein n=1 Tax=Adineta ricciae TaxID=249248 RepID=A0A814KNG1_ADIRI|nr:unnamed protein product [Adineta ricciae]CAF1441052.1 unnamed protein product [Adineta ricciae]
MENINNVVSVATDENLETFSLAWLDEEVDSTEENKQTQQQLRQIINHLKTFHDKQQCHDYVTSLSSQDRLVLIVSGRCGQELVPQIHSLRQVSAIYVYSKDEQANEQWTKCFIKVQKVATQAKDLIDHIKTNQNNQTKADEPLSINIFNSNGASDQSTTELNGNFLHSLLLIDVLLRLKPNDKDKDQFITLCKQHFHDNHSELAFVDEFKREYSSDKAVWWYSRPSFVYKMLNKALRVQNIEILFLFRFVINDIYRQLKQHQCASPSPVRVYRGQVMSSDELEILRRSIGELISINSFFSTSLKREKASAFLPRSTVSGDLHCVLFDIHADPAVLVSKPFAKIKELSISRYEEEVLFMTGCIFRLNKIWPDDNKNMWVIEMQLCDDNEHDLKTLFDHMKEDHADGDDETDFRTFGRILRRMGKFELAEKMLQRHLNELPPNDPLLRRVYWSLGMVTRDKGDYDASLKWFEKSLEIYMKTKSSDYVTIGNLYNCIGESHRRKNDNEKALEYFKKAIALFEEAHAEDHPDMAHIYNNIGLIYENQKKYSEALAYYEKSLDIRKKHLPADHPDIAMSYNNMGCIYGALERYDLAMEHYTRALKIRLKSLPADHPKIGTSNYDIGRMYYRLRQYDLAMKHHTLALEIRLKSLPADHPKIGTSNYNIGCIYDALERYDLAMEHYTRALEIRLKSLPREHLDIAKSYSSIGVIHKKKGEWREALANYETAAKIYRSSLPLLHRYVMAINNDIARVASKLKYHSIDDTLKF